MNKERQIKFAKQFKELHKSPKILVLANAWDAGSAVIFEKEGFEAIGTTSAGIAYSLGYADGENISVSDLIDTQIKIGKKINVPLSVDIETGFGNNTEEVLDTVRKVTEHGAVGINIDDGRLGEKPSLFPEQEQCSKIREIQKLKEETGIPFIINARTDLYWLAIGEPEKRFAEVIKRANLYLEAGADCIFIPGVLEKTVINDLVKNILGQINIIITPICPTPLELQDLGVSRLSLGSGPVRSSIGIVKRIANELQKQGTSSSMFETGLPYSEVNEFFKN